MASLSPREFDQEMNEGPSDLELAFVAQGLSIEQARKTLRVVSGEDEALKLLGYYRDIDDREFAGYDELLATVDSSKTLRRAQDLYDKEVSESTTLIPREACFMGEHKDKEGNGRDTPESGSHFYEHQATRQLD
ncbi:MAG: hypothetical protein KKB79_01930 [Nanoarchaeota archaeon]|nr:hypothetical protein [Nanoarchaeota archaeon]